MDADDEKPGERGSYVVCDGEEAHPVRLATWRRLPTI
jgi:hypothetical protein